MLAPRTYARPVTAKTVNAVILPIGLKGKKLFVLHLLKPETPCGTHPGRSGDCVFKGTDIRGRHCVKAALVRLRTRPRCDRGRRTHGREASSAKVQCSPSAREAVWPINDAWMRAVEDRAEVSRQRLLERRGCHLFEPQREEIASATDRGAAGQPPWASSAWRSSSRAPMITSASARPLSRSRRG